MTPTRLLALGVAVAALLSGCNEDKDKSTPVHSPAQAVDAVSSSLAAVAVTTAGFTSETKAFREWTAVCDNLNNCTAYGPAADNGGYLMVKLAAGPAAKPSVMAGSIGLEVGGNPLSLIIDGRTYSGRNLTDNDDDPILLIASPSDQLIGAIGNGNRAQLSAAGKSTPVTLSGAAAAFLWIDERQGRLGTTTALIRKGQNAANTVPAAPIAPRLTAAPSIAQNALPGSLARQVASLPEVRTCISDNANSPSSDDSFAVSRVGSNLLLWSVPCGAGAYNFAQIYALSANDGSSARLVSLPSPQEPKTIVINSRFDTDTNTLAAFNKGRGIGDCGDMSEWQWTGQHFELKTQYVMEDCLGVSMDYWPATWSTAK